MQSGIISLSNKLPSKAKGATGLTNLRSSSLSSLDQFHNDDCNVLLDKKELKNYKDN